MQEVQRFNKVLKFIVLLGDVLLLNLLLWGFFFPLSGNGAVEFMLFGM